MELTTKNIVKERLKNGEKIAAAWAQAASNITSEILGQAGFDVVMIDLEHAPHNTMTMITQIQSLKGEKAVPFVRAPWNDFVQIKQILDAGIYGVSVPYVNTKQEAEMAVRAVKYPTKGIRGVAGSPRAAKYGNNIREYLDTANDEIFLMVAIETPEAVDNLDDILEVEELDGIFIGPMDLATSMGHFCNPQHEEVQAAIKTIEDKVFASGKALATVAGDWENAKRKYDKGYNMLILMSDTTTLSQVACDRIKKFSELYR